MASDFQPKFDSEWPGGHSLADAWDAKATRRVLDELFCFARQYRTSEAYKELLDFLVGFRQYAPYNALLVHTQLPGARYVLPAHRWARDYGRHIKSAARPLVMLRPMGPIMFVFDVSDTEPGPHAVPLPADVTNPLAVRRGTVRREWDRTVENARRDGVAIQPRKEGSQSGGSIRPAPPGKFLWFPPDSEKGVEVPRRYDILYNEQSNRETRYATLAHELGHLYCGHLGTPNAKWWPDRYGLDGNTEEFEAESTAFLVCGRLRIETPSAEYLAGYLGTNAEVPKISVDAVMKAAGLIEKMGRERMKPRKAGE